ncbi:MAG: hypothetical protein JXB38_12525 [Anaerolineales bacterium]|nr:hypothetical protein [Anaerolineales bacterium]
MAKSRKELYRFHTENLREVERSISTITLTIRHAISTQNQKQIYSLIRLYSLLLGVWAECRLNKLLYEEKSFSEQTRKKILEQKTLSQKWHKTIELAYRKHYNIKRGVISQLNTSHTAYYRYQTICSMLDTDLTSIIELRNKLAHGQWVFPLNSKLDNVSQKELVALRNENLLSLQFKKKLISVLSSIIHDLVVSKATFERDFDNHFDHIVQTKLNLNNRKYSDYEKNMIEKYQRGLSKRKPE